MHVTGYIGGWVSVVPLLGCVSLVCMSIYNVHVCIYIILSLYLMNFILHWTYTAFKPVGKQLVHSFFSGVH